MFFSPGVFRHDRHHVSPWQTSRFAMTDIIVLPWQTSCFCPIGERQTGVVLHMFAGISLFFQRTLFLCYKEPYRSIPALLRGGSTSLILVSCCLSLEIVMNTALISNFWHIRLRSSLNPYSCGKEIMHFSVFSSMQFGSPGSLCRFGSGCRILIVLWWPGKTKLKEETLKYTICLSYVSELSEDLRWVRWKFVIRTVFTTISTLRQELTGVKDVDPPLSKTDAVYKDLCSCGKFRIHWINQ